MLKRPAWIVAYTIVEPDLTMSDHWKVFATRKEALETWRIYILADNVRFCVCGQLKAATEQHWMDGDIGGTHDEPR
jgi:hypothetical protein